MTMSVFRRNSSEPCLGGSSTEPKRTSSSLDEERLSKLVQQAFCRPCVEKWNGELHRWLSNPEQLSSQLETDAPRLAWDIEVIDQQTTHLLTPRNADRFNIILSDLERTIPQSSFILSKLLCTQVFYNALIEGLNPLASQELSLSTNLYLKLPTFSNVRIIVEAARATWQGLFVAAVIDVDKGATGSCQSSFAVPFQIVFRLNAQSKWQVAEADRRIGDVRALVIGS